MRTTEIVAKSFGHDPPFVYKGTRVLVVDDDEFICLAIGKHFAELGAETDHCSDSKAAMELIQSTDYDVIFSDIHMPVYSGHDLLKTAQIWRPDTPVIIMTANPTLENSIASLRLGAYDFMVKPFNIEVLTVTLKRAIQYRRLLLDNRSYQKNLERLVQHRTKQLEELLLQAVGSLTKALEARDPYTQGHGSRVARLVLELARKLDVPEHEHNNLTWAAELHDIGKIGIPDSILLKPDKLTREEYEVMKTHVSIGYSILSRIPSLKTISEYIHQHHERMDGKGYPRGLAGEEIHYNSRLLIVSEVCDALATERCYKPAWSKKDIIEYFEDHSGTAYDPEVAGALTDILRDRGDEIIQMLQGHTPNGL